ncbi:MAG: hypothetical protein JNL82_41860 [Myxococcales bacterium]|nr:hypothetical protein [Myxococcales bacterium]
MKDLQNRTLTGAPLLTAESPSILLRQIRRVLKDALDSDLLKIAEDVIHKHVQLERSGDDDCEYVIFGGPKDFRRDDASARLIRDDLAWLHFTLTVRQHAPGRLEMLGYDFEIVFPDGHIPPFIRFDLNLPGHTNELRELRSHLHPGNDELQLPAPVMTPGEMLELLITRLRPRDPGKPRS